MRDVMEMTLGDKEKSQSEGMDGQEAAYPAKGIWVWQLEVAYNSCKEEWMQLFIGSH